MLQPCVGEMQKGRAQAGSGPDGIDRQERRWQPILTGALRDQAFAAIQDIAASLPPARRPDDPPAPSRAVADASLAGGQAGMAIFYAYLARAFSSKNGEAVSLSFLEQAIEAVSATPMGTSLYSGFTGVAWTAAHLKDQLLGPEADDANDAIDETLGAYLSQSPWPGDYDLIGGLVGFGVYALERLPNPRAVACLEHVVDRLHELAVPDEAGIAWFTPPEQLPAWQRALCPQGYYNLGLAHGVPGVIALLGRACAAGVAENKARPLLDGAVTGLLARQPADGGSFPTWIGVRSQKTGIGWQESGVGRKGSRLAWCYGDPGIATALLAAARSVNEPTWEREALAIAQRAARQPFEQAGVMDAGLCHGAAGLGHLFNRLSQATGDDVLGEAARFWLRHALERRHLGQGIAGFSTYHRDTDGSSRWLAEPGLLSGAAGIGLALVAAITPIEPAWDRMLLAAIPPMAGVTTAG